MAYPRQLRPTEDSSSDPDFGKVFSTCSERRSRYPRPTTRKRMELIAAGTRTSNNIAQFSNEFFQLSGEVIMKELLTNIESRQPRTQLKQSAEVLFKMVSVYPDISRNWMINWANVPVASARISVHDKHQLTRSLLGTRNLKKFKESILEFATKSRGLETTLGAHV
ncbi:hypothetical protein SeMB42_g02291 [Synchytrium endobioticum]|uniref:Uncharacterized protein n=1 Tax=Synchytrium endobioticum TaxID=286115 RepID=A0A507DGC8_9FUNG|nr:hypothetical protein SeMB42_g02291 [Synchytrium endobioticum]